MPRPPDERAPDNPWPEWPKVYKMDYGQEEAKEVFVMILVIILLQPKSLLEMMQEICVLYKFTISSGNKKMEDSRPLKFLVRKRFPAQVLFWQWDFLVQKI